MTTETQNLRLDQIRIDGGTQPRVAIDQTVVDEYAERYGESKHLPPVVVFFDGATYWLADGFHRYWANRKIDCNQIFAEVHQGTQRDAILYSVGANADHGLRRSNEDKWKAVKTMLTNPKASKDDDGHPWSDNAIAKRCHVSSPTVAKIRSTLNIQSAPVRKTSDGRTMKTDNIGRKRKSPPRRFQPKPGISPHAMKPIRGHSTHQPKTALELPHDPHWASRAILSAMGHDFARALVKELNAYLEGASE